MTATDWIGPSLYPRARATIRRPPRSYQPGPREPFRGLWLELPEAGDLVRLYDSHGAQRPVGAQDWTTIWLLPAFRGRGLLSAAVGLRWHRLGRDPIDYLWRAAAGSPFTPAGRRSCFAAHREGVRLARAEGLSVSRAVLRSLRLGVDLGDNPRALDPRLAGRFPMSPSTLATLERGAQERGRMDLWRAFASRVVAGPATPR